jgi:hypothetical protein
METLMKLERTVLDPVATCYPSGADLDKVIAVTDFRAATEAIHVHLNRMAGLRHSTYPDNVKEFAHYYRETGLMIATVEQESKTPLQKVQAQALRSLYQALAKPGAQ